MLKKSGGLDGGAGDDSFSLFDSDKIGGAGGGDMDDNSVSFDVNGPDNLGIGRTRGDETPALEIIETIQDAFSQVLRAQSTSESTKEEIRELENEIIYPSRLRAIALNKIFLPPPRKKDSIDRNGPSICVYDNSKRLYLVNGTYLDLAGLNSARQAKQLVREGLLLDAIYDSDTITEIELFVSTIAEGGYRDFTFPLKHKNKQGEPFALRWTTRPNIRDGGDVRVAEDVTGISELKKNFPVDGISGIPFGFLSLVEKFHQKFCEILRNDNTINRKFEELAKIANIGDIIVDQSPFYIAIKQGEDFITMNPMYIATTGYEEDQIILFPEMVQDESEKKSMDMKAIKELGHCHNKSEMTRSDGSKIDISCDISHIADDATIHIGSVI